MEAPDQSWMEAITDWRGFLVSFNLGHRDEVVFVTARLKTIRRDSGICETKRLQTAMAMKFIRAAFISARQDLFEASVVSMRSTFRRGGHDCPRVKN